MKQPSQYVRDITSGVGSATGRASDATLPRGVSQPAQSRDSTPSESGANVAETLVDGECMDPEFAEVLHYAFAVIDSGCKEPQTRAEAMASPEWPQWKEAEEREIAQLRKLGTWEIVPRPVGANIVGGRWTYKYKRDEKGNVIGYKARWVAKGYSQLPGRDFHETFAPVMRPESERTIIAIFARTGDDLRQMDAKGAFLNGILTEDVYMVQADGYEESGPMVDSLPSGQQLVCKLIKGLYGLKQSGRQWYAHLRATLERLGFTRCTADHAVFYRYNSTSRITLGFHVDDFLYGGSPTAAVDQFEKDFGAVYETSFLGPLSWMLATKFERDFEKGTIALSQTAYIESMLERYNRKDARPLAMPMEPGLVLSKDQCPKTPEEIADMRDVPYREAVGSVMYLAITTRADVMHTVATLAQFMQNPGRVHWHALQRLLDFLHGTKDWCLLLGGMNNELEGFTDASFPHVGDVRSISGFVFLFFGGAISWSSKKQSVIALSTTEAEYIALTNATTEAVWLRSLLEEIYGPMLEPTTMYCDNQSAIALAKNSQFHSRTRHIERRFHYVREAVENNLIDIIYCRTDDMAADQFTKSLNSIKVRRFAGMIGLHGL